MSFYIPYLCLQMITCITLVYYLRIWCVQFGTEESAGCGQIHRNNSALVLNRHPIEPHKTPHMTSWSSDITLHKVIWGIYALLWYFYQVPKLSCFCEFVHIKQILLYQIEIVCGRWPRNKKNLQGSNQVHKWSLHAKIWVLEMKNKKVMSKGVD